MNKKIYVNTNKTLKLNNVLSMEVDVSELNDMNSFILTLDNYIKNKGAKPIGPLVQYISVVLEETLEPKMIVRILRQANTFIHNIEKPFKINSIIRVKDCIYARFVGDEDKLKYAYDKINLLAYEENIRLKGDNYTIFVGKDNDELIADIFMERADNE